MIEKFEDNTREVVSQAVGTGYPVMTMEPKKGKKKYRKKSKKELKRALRKAECERDHAIYVAGLVSAQYQMVRLMTELAVSSNRGTLDSEVLDEGLRLLPRGRGR